jgi:hypothetical protein
MIEMRSVTRVRSPAAFLTCALFQGQQLDDIAKGERAWYVQFNGDHQKHSHSKGAFAP